MDDLRSITRRIFNKTRYRTEDIAMVVKAGCPRGLTWSLVVDYYQPSKKAKETWSGSHRWCDSIVPRGLFVKLQRNGDEQNYAEKGLSLIKPTRFDGASELEQLAAMSGEAPKAVVIQMLHRLKLMQRYHGEDRGPDYQTATLAQYEVEAYLKIMDRHNLSLGFGEEEPSKNPSLLEWRRRVVTEQQRVALLKNDLERTKKTGVRFAHLIDRTTKQLEQNEKSQETIGKKLVSAEKELARLLGPNDEWGM